MLYACDTVISGALHHLALNLAAVQGLAFIPFQIPIYLSLVKQRKGEWVEDVHTCTQFRTIPKFTLLGFSAYSPS